MYPYTLHTEKLRQAEMAAEVQMYLLEKKLEKSGKKPTFLPGLGKFFLDMGHGFRKAKGHTLSTSMK